MHIGDRRADLLDDAGRLVAYYDDFARRWAHGTSPLYEDWAAGIAADLEMIARIRRLPPRLQQANLLFAAARWEGAPLDDYERWRSWLVENWDAVLATASVRATQTNEVARCATLLPMLSRIDGPVALLEVGAAAGLCLLPDRYSYRFLSPAGVHDLHPAGGPSAVLLECRIDDARDAPTRMPHIEWRAGIDLAPIDPADPDAIALITFEEITTILPSLFGQFPAENMYFVDGNLSNFGDEFPEGSLTGAKGTLPGLSIDTLGEFTGELDAFLEEEGSDPLEEYSYAAESFDATVLLALASLASGSTDPADIAASLQEVSGGTGDGETCTSYAECADIIVGGGTADYDGVSGPITFDEVGDPTEASIGIYEYGDDNTYAAWQG